MVGYARLNRGKIVVETMLTVPQGRWERFVTSLHLDERCEFGEGDLGLPGALQVAEPAVLNPVTVDQIRRFGGSTSPNAQWPEDDAGPDDDDRYDRLEKLIGKAVKRVSGDQKTSKEHSKEGTRQASVGTGS